MRNYISVVVLPSIATVLTKSGNSPAGLTYYEPLLLLLELR